ncbi:Xanthine/uracil permease family protein [Rhynchospora pubera]|uniref:Xanthine/uracil permease family protein n=1 Tax=Rhynchospora pubera TaxID=906938 RepID=A0AAV8CN01_9POAL|nr:Xanthine/uracil permease family protein [Rhynchospora pubera]
MGKEDEFVPYPVKEQLPGIDYCITSPPPWHTTMLVGFQHYVIMLGTIVLIATILVPQMGGGYEEKARVIQSMLFVAGINTLLQVYFGTRLPVVIGGSFAYLIPTLSIILSRRYTYFIDPYERFIYTMRAIQGAMICASIFQLVVGYFGLWGVCIRFLSPVIAAPWVALSALGLYYIAFPALANCVEIGLPALIILVLLFMYAPYGLNSGSFIFSRCAVLVTIIIVWIYAHILTAAGAYNERPPETQYSCRTDRAGIIWGSPWVRIPYPLQWGRPYFYAGDAFAMIAASFVSLIEVTLISLILFCPYIKNSETNNSSDINCSQSTGTFIAVQRFCSATFMPPSIFSRGIGWQGIAIMLDGLVGTANGSAASVENSGFLAVTRVGSRRVIKISACFMIFFSIFAKFGAVIASIPIPLFFGIYCVLYAYAASAGIGLLQFCNINSLRNKFIIGFALIMGLSIPQFFREYFIESGYGPMHTHSRTFNDIVNVIFSSSATVGAIIAYLLDWSHCYWDDTVRKDRGLHWFYKFRSYSSDARCEEFYALPYSLSKYFPSY